MENGGYFSAIAEKFKVDSFLSYTGTFYKKN